MRTWTVVMLALFATACGLKKYVPEGPVVSAAERARGWGEDVPSGAVYTGKPEVAFPVLPVQVFGAAYALDLVLVSKHPTWNMHEYAMLETPEGPLWLAKDAREATMSQSLVGAGVGHLMPEIPLQRKESPVEVEDASTAELLDLVLRYENIDGEPVEVRYRGPRPDKAMDQRNASTMGHSQDTVMAVLDLSHRRFARSASITIGGEEWGLRRVMGLVPLRLALRQVQGGLAVADFEQRGAVDWVEEPEEREVLGATPGEASDAGGTERSGRPSIRFSVVRGGEEEPWEVRRSDRTVEAVQEGELRTLVYRFRVGEDEAWELVSMDVEQVGRQAPPTHIELSPPLPDLRRPFEGRLVSRYVVDVNGQQGHAVGRLEAWWDGEVARVALIPEAPPWTVDRPMETTVTFGEGTAHVQIVRTP